MAGDDVDEDVADAAPTNPEDEDEEVQRTSVFLTRLLFLLFSDGAGLWEQGLFYRFVHEHTTSENLGGQLDALFDVLNTSETKRRQVPESMAAFPYVNGALFDRAGETRTTTFFSPAMREALLEACRFHWTDISPAIFGSLFQLVKSKEARRLDGEHYTSEKNILKTLKPLFLDELREEADRLINSKSTSVKKLREFRDSLATHVFMDPACGSGNFLIVAYRELRKIETDVIVAIREREGNTAMSLDITWEQKLSIGQFYGIELNRWPARIAETAMFLVDHQANRELADKVGRAPGPQTDFYTRRYRRSFGRGADGFRCEKAEAVLRIPFPRFSSRFSRRRRLRSSSIVSLTGVVRPSRVEALSRYHARNVARDTPRSSPTCSQTRCSEKDSKRTISMI
ncbi:hypothetical protein D8M20_04495 [Corynebacterium propinquum]|nr:hypothetical protein D8M24_04495 [Corynebacterium propinquum]RUP89458.1 hypothetical protein D8M40_05220 [Corynebacterium propinquum]RUP95346.1 hypothetical protein D8M20_04495 [Corynebacterium propinquum]